MYDCGGHFYNQGRFAPPFLSRDGKEFFASYPRRSDKFFGVPIDFLGTVLKMLL
jgi:hypothetical protein